MTECEVKKHRKREKRRAKEKYCLNFYTPKCLLVLCTAVHAILCFAAFFLFYFLFIFLCLQEMGEGGGWVMGMPLNAYGTFIEAKNLFSDKKVFFLCFQALLTYLKRVQKVSYNY